MSPYGQPMDPSDLATKLSDVIAKVVRPRYRVYEEQGMVFIDGGHYRAAADVADFVDADGDLVDNVRKAADGALSMVQDYIAEHLTTPWPIKAGELPEPMVEVTPDSIRLWFETQNGEKVLELDRIAW